MQPTRTKYPPDSEYEKITSTLAIKKAWLYSEWDSKALRRVAIIREDFPDRQLLASQDASCEKIQRVFHTVRGQYILWQEPREQGSWRKVTANRLPLQWIKDNVEVLYPSEEIFSIASLDGIVLWRDPKKEKYQLLEGNHRISSWLSTGSPETLPCTLFIGKPANNSRSLI